MRTSATACTPYSHTTIAMRRLLGKAAFKLGNADQAQTAYRAAVTANDGAPAAWMGLAELADATGAWELAAEAYERLVQHLLAHRVCTLSDGNLILDTQPPLRTLIASCRRSSISTGLTSRGSPLPCCRHWLNVIGSLVLVRRRCGAGTNSTGARLRDRRQGPGLQEQAGPGLPGGGSGRGRRAPAAAAAGCGAGGGSRARPADEAGQRPGVDGCYGLWLDL